ncbi:hypothetical protein VIGAN_05135800 [Vigna angularis var. angularis]|uniref:Uncharacterized protein n=1 Tax=Vigna angularis var. angularis TaxID=157739 RepID=A0A0S3S566_PHAAN|nr:hypothetical protein VIGAN_05135800 [Vigna angularis var. angularis]
MNTLCNPSCLSNFKNMMHVHEVLSFSFLLFFFSFLLFFLFPSFCFLCYHGSKKVDPTRIQIVKRYEPTVIEHDTLLISAIKNMGPDHPLHRTKKPRVHNVYAQDDHSSTKDLHENDSIA